MNEISELIRTTREQKQISLEDVERDTKIAKRYLISIEAGNWQDLPGDAYAIGFLRTYGKYLEINDSKLVNYYKVNYGTPVEDLPEADDNIATKVKSGLNYIKKSKVLLVVVVLVAVFFVGAVIYAMLHQSEDIPTDPGLAVNHNEQTEPQQPHVPITPQEPVTPVTPQEPVTPVQPEITNEKDLPKELGFNDVPQESVSVTATGLKLVINADNGRCWLRVKIDGKFIPDSELEKGESVTYTAKESINIVYGNAGAIKVTLNGVDQGTLGVLTQVVKKEYIAK